MAAGDATPDLPTGDGVQQLRFQPANKLNLNPPGRALFTSTKTKGGALKTTRHADLRYRERTSSCLPLKLALRLSVKVPKRRVVQVLDLHTSVERAKRVRSLSFRLTAEGCFVMRGRTAVTCLPLRGDQLATFLVAEMTGVWV